MRTVVFLSLLLASSVVAEEPGVFSQMQKGLEMPAHRSLAALIDDPDTTLTPFETDGCSGGMSWSWRVVADRFPDFEAAQGAVPPWEACCVVHDEAYHNAGGATEAEASYAARLDADDALRFCVARPEASEVTALADRYDVTEDQIRYAYELIAQSMYNAVRFGGGPCSGLPWRWGFGFPGCVPGF
jgi:hypothetical protein